MGDIAVSFSQTTGLFDWSLLYGDLADTSAALTSDLETSCIISLFTDLTANSDYKLPNNVRDQRGYWGDAYEPSPLGSNLWQLKYIPKTNSLLQIARKMCADSLQWLIDDGIAASVAVSTNWYAPNRTDIMMIGIVITEPVTNKTTRFRWSWCWAQIAGQVYNPVNAQGGAGSTGYFNYASFDSAVFG